MLCLDTSAVTDAPHIPPPPPLESAGAPGRGPHGNVVGTILDGRYRIIRPLGDGGMATVFLAEQIILKKPVAVKILHQRLCHDDTNVERFLREAQAASMIRHENVVDIIDFGQVPGGSVFIAMELLDGDDLDRVLARDRRLDWPRTHNIITQVVRALAAAHDKGIIHRDMKPANCYLVERLGNPEFIKVLDFGIAKIHSGTAAGLTETGAVFGTAKYMAPEQACGESVDPRCDVYAVGVMMYELLTGSVPFEGDSFMRVLTRHMNELPEAPSHRCPEANIPPAVEALIMTALEKRPEDRFSSMAALGSALDSLAGGARAIRAQHGQTGATQTSAYSAAPRPPSWPPAQTTGRNAPPTGPSGSSPPGGVSHGHAASQPVGFPTQIHTSAPFDRGQKTRPTKWLGATAALVLVLAASSYALLSPASDSTPQPQADEHASAGHAATDRAATPKDLGELALDRSPSTATLAGNTGQTSAEPITTAPEPTLAMADPTTVPEAEDSRSSGTAVSDEVSPTTPVPTKPRDTAGGRTSIKSTGTKSKRDKPPRTRVKKPRKARGRNSASTTHERGDESPAVARANDDEATPALRSELSRSELKRGLVAARTAARDCGALATVKVRFSVAPDGRVTTAAALRPHDRTEQGKCVERAVRAARFPKTSKKVLSIFVERFKL